MTPFDEVVATNYLLIETWRNSRHSPLQRTLVDLSPFKWDYLHYRTF
jgi:hypothetical protein